MNKNRMLFVITLAASLGLIVGYRGSNLGFVLGYTLLALFLVSLISILFAPFFIKTVESVENSRGAKNTRIKYSLTLRNRSVFLYPRVRLVFYNDDLIEYSTASFNNKISPMGTNKLYYTVSVPYRGIYRAGVKQIIITDFLGLFNRKIAGDSMVSITIYPQYDSALELSIKNEAQRPDMVKNFFSTEDNTTVADIREYQFSDSPKQIHWKLSAKKGNLLIKEFSPLITKNVALFLDTKELTHETSEKFKLEDGIISYLLSGINYCIEEGLSASLILGRAVTQQKLIEHSSQMGEITDMLATVKFDESHSTMESLLYLPKDYNYVIYLSNINTRVYSIIHELISYENKTIIYYFILKDSPLDNEQKRILDSLSEYNAEVNLIEII